MQLGNFLKTAQPVGMRIGLDPAARQEIVARRSVSGQR
jgi:hypothetical protein